MTINIVRKIKKLCPHAVVDLATTVVRRSRRIWYKNIMRLYPGAMVFFCPCCNIKVKKFSQRDFVKETGTFNKNRYQNAMQNVICPVCHSLPRHRILAAWCDEHKEILRNSRILYFAPEQSMELWMKRNKVTYTSCDLRFEADLKLDIQATDLPDASYDVVIANHVLEHVDDFRKALKEMYRILKPTGCFICSFPMDPKIELLDEEEEPLTPEERLQRFGQIDHKRVFGIKADQFLTIAGFEVETIRGENYSEEILPVVGPADYDINILFCCRKQSFG